MSETFTRELSAVIDLIDKYQRFKVSGAELVNELKAALTPAAGREQARTIEILSESTSKLLKRAETAEAKLAAITGWLDANQPDVFRRGLWDAVGKVELASRAAAPEPPPAKWCCPKCGSFRVTMQHPNAPCAAICEMCHTEIQVSDLTLAAAPAPRSLRERIEKLERRKPNYWGSTNFDAEGEYLRRADVLAAIGWEGEGT